MTLSERMKRAQNDSNSIQILHWSEEVALLEQRIEELERALIFAGHRSTCSVFDPMFDKLCTCGWGKIKEALAQQEEEA